jgi:hypothetical protein
MKILMKFTSRERFKILLGCIQYYVEYANNLNDMVWLFTLDANDETFDFNLFKEHLINLKIYDKSIIVLGKSESKIDAINRDVSLIKDWDILLNISDDQFPIIRGYDDLIRQNMKEDLDCSLWFNDSHQDRTNTQEIIGRNYYKRFNYIYYPHYKSFFCDNEATLVGIKLEKIIYIPTTIIKHLHPSWAGNVIHNGTDALYDRNQLTWDFDEYLYKEREKINFV